MIIGNLCRDPELRQVNGSQGPIPVCDFTVAVNRRKSPEGQPEADFFRVTAWRGLGELCKRCLAKGRKVCVVGPVSLSTYTGNDGVTRAGLEVTADEVEFLSPKTDGAQAGKPKAEGQAPEAPQYVEVAADEDDMPF